MKIFRVSGEENYKRAKNDQGFRIQCKNSAHDQIVGGYQIASTKRG